MSFCCTGCLSRQEGTCLLLAGLGAFQRNGISHNFGGPEGVAVSHFPWNHRCQLGHSTLCWVHFSKTWLDTSALCYNLGSFSTDWDFDLERGWHLPITLSTTHDALRVELKICACPQSFPICCWRTLCSDSQQCTEWIPCSHLQNHEADCCFSKHILASHLWITFWV